MSFLKTAVFGTAFAVLSGTTALAGGHGCAVTEGRINIVGNEFPAIQSVAAAALSCADGIDAESNLTADHQKINVAGMTGNPAEYTSAIIANSSIVALINEDVIRPLDDLIAAYGQDIPARQLITIDGKVMAVAFMANAQHLVYRSDVLEQIGMDVPTSYEEVLAAAEKSAYAAGWNLAEEFVNMYLGAGGEFFTPGTAEVSINNAQGVLALETMKALTEYMNPDFLTHDSNATSAEWEAGEHVGQPDWRSDGRRRR